MLCDLCGTSNAQYLCNIEGSELNVCPSCSKYGTALRRIKQTVVRPKPKKEEVSEDIVPNYAEVIRKKRESMGLTQEDFAKKVREKVSVIHKTEVGQRKPDLVLAKKLERMLGIKLIAQSKSESVSPTKRRTESLTIGDVLNVA